MKRKIAAWVAGGVAAALVVTLAVVANGFDSREIPREDPTIWVERSAGQYARVNTETAEIDTVRVAESPSGIVQTSDLGLLFTQGFGQAHTINPASPLDVHDAGAAEAEPAADAEDQAVETTTAEEAADQATANSQDAASATDADDTAAMRTPSGTRQVLVAANRVLFFTQNGETYLAQTSPSGAGATAKLSAPTLLNPLAKEQEKAASEESEQTEQGAEAGQAAPTQYVASAAAIDERGMVALYSGAEQAIRWFDAETSRWQGGPVAVGDGAPTEDVQLAIVAGKWVLFNTTNGDLWREGGAGPIGIEISGVAQLQDSSASDKGVLVADEKGLWVVDNSGSVERTVSAAGVAAQPRFVAGQAVAAWVGAVTANMWTAERGEVELELDPAVEDLSNAEPEIRTNGSRALVAERGSGMMWTVPGGQLIPVEQWTLVDPPKQEAGNVVTQDVTEQEPPVAVDDAFGVRAGEPALLSLLLNDYDPNRKDVLTVLGEGLGEGLSADFGTVTPLSDGQGAVITPAPNAQGTASFSYRITDGVNVSQPATVTLTVVPPDTNTGPQWCAVEGCQRIWPSPEIAPGGTLILPILEGFVDPEGDPMMLAGAAISNEEDPLRALVTSDGRLAVRHLDPNAPAGDYSVKVMLQDSRGAETERDLRVRVRSGAAIEFASAATTVKVNEALTFRPLERVTGGSGAFQLVDATVQQGAVTAQANTGTGTVEILASAAGNAIVGVTVRDTVTDQEAVGVIRVNAVEARGAFAVPPLRAFVRALADSTVDVLAAVPGANSRALTVRSATVRDGQLRADVIEHSTVRVSGSTVDGQPGRIGSVDVAINDGELVSQGRLTVFQVGDTGAGVIAVTDTATVRAGSVVDIPVLENDVAPPGERLVLHPEIGASGAAGELAFASGSRVRYLAPSEPGVYTLSYTTYGASSPEQLDSGQVRVTVLAAGSNRDPQPATVTLRVAPGESVKATIPLSGVDPDGDRLRLVSIAAPEDPQLQTSILPRTNSVQVAASASALQGTQIVSYTVRDSFGGEATGSLRIIVTEPDPGGGAPVVYSDYVRIARGASEPATVRPLDNDLDPSGGTLQLVLVVPNVPGGEASEQYQALMSRLDLAQMKQGVVRVAGGDELGTVSFKYTVKSSKTKSTADGLIVVQVSERIGQQAPQVTDTVLSVRDRADFERVGVDVVTDRVRWAGGDAASLTLSLWGSAENRYKISGSSILGSYKAEGDLVPFRLAGTDMTGEEVETFGFLIVPPLDELRLSLKATAQAINVAENKSIDVDIAEMLDLGQGDRAELDQANFTTQRPQASCQAVGATTIRYSAGKEAPWADSCAIRVRLTEQSTFTTLPVPVSIVPNEPVVQLTPLTRTVAPGAGEAINLTDMVQWQGGREGALDSLRWQLGGGTSAFEITTSGATVQVQARADAVPGAQEVLSVSVTGAGESQSLLTLRVGEAAVDAPRGGTVSLQCTVGSSCSAPLIGIAGEHDPFAGKSGGGLQLVSVSDGGCKFGSMQASGNQVSVSWADAGGPGGKCTASFTVRDAQNRTGTGTIEFDAQGVPRAPVGVTAVAADASSVTLSVGLSGEAAHPEVTGVKLMSGGASVGSCSLGGGQATCVVSGLTPGARATYSAVAVNSVGDSAASATGVETWAYKPPAPPALSGGDAQPWAENTNTEQGKVRIKVGQSSAATRVLVIDGAETQISGDEIYTLKADLGAREVYAYSLDAPSMIPPAYIGGDGGKGEAAHLTGVVPIGAPTTGTAALELTGANRTDWQITTTGFDANGGGALQYTYTLGAYSGPSNSGSGLTEHQSYTGTVSAATAYGVTGVATTNEELSGSKLPFIQGEYTTNKFATNTSNWSVLYAPGEITYSITPTGTLSSVEITPASPTAEVQQCATGGVNCSDPPGLVAPTGVKPLSMTLTACVPWDGVTLPNHTQINSLVTTVGELGGVPVFVANPDETITVQWGDIREDATFIGALCPLAP